MSKASRVSGPDGRYDLMAKAVIACAGGFQANPEMRARYLAGNTDLMKVRGSQARHRRGPAHAARSRRALGRRHWQSGHMSPIDANAPDFETPQHEDGRGNTQSRYDYPFRHHRQRARRALLRRGRGAALLHLRQDRPRRARPAGRAARFQIYDQKGLKLPALSAPQGDASSKPTRSRSWPRRPASSRRCSRTRSRNSTAPLPTTCRSIRRRLDGKRHPRPRRFRNRTGPIRIDEPPFRAYPVTCGITFTFGGVEVNRNAQVMNTIDQPIKGLFASGDIVGLFFHNYPSFTGQTRNAVFGRLAGSAAVAEN